jgi:iron complex outermembrane receptor protein
MKTIHYLLAFALCLPIPIIAQSETGNEDKSVGEAVVTGTREKTDMRHLPMTVTVVGREELTQGHRPSTLPTLSELVPGLFVTSRGVLGYGVSGGAAGGINLRGVSGGAGQLLVLIDGHPQYQGIYGHPISDSYQTMLAERVEVVHGPASVLYGSNAMGGVINIVTRKPATENCETNVCLGMGSYGTLQTEAGNQIRTGKFSSTVGAQYNRSDNHRSRMGFEQYGGHVKLGYDLNKNWNTSLDANVTHFNASQPGAVTSPLYDADQWITRGAVSAAVENHYDRTSGGLSVYTNFGRHKIDDGTANPDNPTMRYFRSKDALTGVSMYQSLKTFPGNRITAGVDYQHIYGLAYFTSKADGTILDTPNKQSGRSYRNEVAGYVDVRQDINFWLTADAGVRLDHHSITGNEWVPQFGIVVRPTSTSDLKLMASKGFRNPTMREMYLYPPSNTDLRPERLWNYELSWRHCPGTLTYGVNLFYINGDNMIQTVPVDGRPRNVNTGKIENMGVEALAEYKLTTHWRLHTNHSLLHMVHKVVGAPIYKGYFGASYTQHKWTANIGAQQLANLYTSATTKESVLLLNASASYRLLEDLSLWARGENLLAQRYEINAGFPMPRATFMAGVNLKF